MDNKTALFLAIVIIGLVVANYVFGWEAHIFLGRKFVQLTEYMAFWR